MGWLSKLKKALTVAETVAPLLPVPDRVKQGVAKAGEIERDAEDLAKIVKPPKPAA